MVSRGGDGGNAICIANFDSHILSCNTELHLPRAMGCTSSSRYTQIEQVLSADRINSIVN